MATSYPQESIDQEDPELTEVKSKRQLTLTEKGHSFFTESVEHNLHKLTRIGKEIDDIIECGVPKTFEEVEKVKSSITDVLGRYKDLSADLLIFMSKYNTTESAREQSSVRVLKDFHDNKVSKFINELDIVLHRLGQKETPEQPPLSDENVKSKSTFVHSGTEKSKSTKSRSSQSSRSSRSSVTTLLGRQRAKLDGAQEKLRFAQQEAAMKKEAALLSIKMELLQAEKEAAVASAEYSGMKLELDDDVKSESEDVNKSDMINRYFDSIATTSVKQEYVQSLPVTVQQTQPTYVPQVDTFAHTTSTTDTSQVAHQFAGFSIGHDPTQAVAGAQQFNSSVYNDSTMHSMGFEPSIPVCLATCDSMVTTESSGLTAPRYVSAGQATSLAPITSCIQSVPQLTCNTLPPPQATNVLTPPNLPSTTYAGRNILGAEMSEFSNYLIKREMLPLRVTDFDDRPETYQSWKISFNIFKTELKATPREELDLLIKYLGTKSKQHALSIRSANASWPARAVQLIWNRLDERYGSPVLLESSLKARIEAFPQLTPKDNARLYDLADLLIEIQSRMEDPALGRSLNCFDSSTGMRPIVSKLPYNLQEKWTSRASNYNAVHQVTYPPFTFLVKFVSEISRIRNDPGFIYQPTGQRSTGTSDRSTAGDAKGRESLTRKDSFRVKKTDIDTNKGSCKLQELENRCMLHDAKHNLNQCKSFQKLSLNERKKLLKDYNFCFKCCLSTRHNYKTCRATVKCDACGNANHATAMHADGTSDVGKDTTQDKSTFMPKKEHGGEESLVTKCTTICGNNFSGRSCAKACLVNVYPEGKPDLRMKMYALLDDQSTSTLARPEFFDIMKVPLTTMRTYTLTSCAGQFVMGGRQAKGFIIESKDGISRLDLPVITECSEIPDERSEIPTPEITQHYSHLKNVPIPTLDSEAPILLLIGRDLPEAHHIEAQRIGPKGTPFAQKLKLGWVLIGNVCLGTTHPPSELNVLKTSITKDGRESLFADCESTLSLIMDDNHLFKRERHDNSIGPSVEDEQFLCLMDKQFKKTPSGNWTAPLPFKKSRPLLPNNRNIAFKRALMLQSSLRKNPVKRQHFVTFMQRIFDSGHAEVAPPVEESAEVWYLPLFGIYHPKKVDQIRVVFDSSCKHEGVSLNSVLMQGPDLMNRLDGVLLRFRKEPVAVVADIQQMFFNFYVDEGHRDYLRFFWHNENDPDQHLVEFRMCVHVFGNSPSPAVATFGLRRCVEDSVGLCGEDVKEFVTRNFYVDDGLMSFPTAEEAADVLKRTQKALLEGGNLKLHKIASNSDEVMSQFPAADLAKTLKSLDLAQDDLPLHHSLGLEWELSTDAFTYHVAEEQKPFTKRGLLSTVNGIFDPLGFLAPIVIKGKIIMRDAVSSAEGWDEPLSPHIVKVWKTWTEQLSKLSEIHIPRCILSVSSSKCINKTLHIFSDASEQAISACAFLRGVTDDQEIYTGFVFGKSKVAPKHGHTIPRLELCAAVMATEIAEMLSIQLDFPLDDIRYYTDSRVVLGYLSNERRRFYVYVTNRVSRIKKVSSPKQWYHVPSEKNPADEGTRGLLPEQFANSLWFNGVDFLHYSIDEEAFSDAEFSLVEPEMDKEVRPEVHTMKTTSISSLGSSRFSRFSTWDSLLRAITTIRQWMRSRVNIPGDLSRREIELFIFKEIQLTYFHKEILALRNSRSIPKDSSILCLNPFLDEGGLLRVGGRIKKGDFQAAEKFPILVPGRSHVAKLIVQHYHQKIHHQGRRLTEGAIRNAGLWITGGKRLIASIIHHCLTCRRLRGKFACQLMSDLPQDRLTPTPPFTFVGVDVFGPWSIVTRRTRGGSATSKRWAVLFTCLYSRAVHIETVAEMTSSSFINAMRRFIAIRGKVSEFRSDCGTNFVGAVNEMKIHSINVGDPCVKHYLDSNNLIWRFNPPHSSHFGGVWERMIGIARRILDAMLLEVKHGQLTDEVLNTFMAEVSAIINSRPLVSISSDPEMPNVLSPGLLLTQKIGDDVTTFQDLNVKDMYRSQWRMVQVMANTFWKRWKSEFLPTLQTRAKWKKENVNLKVGDLVLLQDKDYPRISWPTGVVTQTFPSDDGLVRKLEVRVFKDGKQCLFVRPISQVVPLIVD